MTDRNLVHLTWPEIRDLDKTHACVVLPIGAVEQHGPHLPVLTDTLLVEHTLNAALERLPVAAQVWRLPVLSYGKSNEHLGFPGTFTLSAATLMATLRDLGSSVKASGFSRLVFINSHGGNRATLEIMARDLHSELGLMVFNLNPGALVPDPIETPALEQQFGIHAGDWETSLVLALEPQWVKFDRADRSFPDFPQGAVTLTASGAGVAWLTRDWSSSGTFGDATMASAERGNARFEPIVARLTEVLEQICTFPIVGEVKL